MRTKLVVIVLFCVVVMILALPTAKAMAFSDEPCYGWNYDCDTCVTDGCVRPQDSRTVTDGSWTIKFVGIDQPEDFKPDWWRWHYQIFNNSTGTQSGLNVAAWLIPDCCKAPKVEFSYGYYGLSRPANLTPMDVGVGETSTGFGEWIKSGFVLRGTPVGSTIDWYLAANTTSKTVSTVFIKAKSYQTSFEIEVPGCTPAPVVEQVGIGGRTYTECINTGQETTAPFSVPGVEGTFPADYDDISFYIVRNSNKDGCVARIWACHGLYCPDCKNEVCPTGGACVELTGIAQDEGTIIEGSLLRSCPDENFNIKSGSPIYKYTWNSGNQTYTKCLDLATYLWITCP